MLGSFFLSLFSGEGLCPLRSSLLCCAEALPIGLHFTLIRSDQPWDHCFTVRKSIGAAPPSQFFFFFKRKTAHRTHRAIPEIRFWGPFIPGVVENGYLSKQPYEQYKRGVQMQWFNCWDLGWQILDTTNINNYHTGFTLNEVSMCVCVSHKSKSAFVVVSAWISLTFVWFKIKK